MAAGKKDEKSKNQQADNDKDTQPDDEATAAAKEKKQKRNKILMFVGFALLLVAISVGATFFVVKSLLHKESKTETTESSQSSSSEADAKASAAASESSSSAEPLKPAIYKPLRPNFMVNYDVNGRQRFLQAELTLMYRDEAVASVIETHMPEVRNGLVLLLSNQKFDDLLTVEGKEKLRELALASVQEVVNKESLANAKANEKEKDKEKNKKPVPNVEQVLFTNFIMQ